MFKAIQHITLIRKSQMSLLDWADTQPKHAEQRRRSGSMRHLANGATVAVAATTAKVMVRGKEGRAISRGTPVYYKTEDMPRKMKGTVHHIEGEMHTIQPNRQGHVYRPAQITIHRDQIWTEDEHRGTAAAPQRTTEGHVAVDVSNARAVTAQEQTGLTETEVIKHPTFLAAMKNRLKHLAISNGMSADYREHNGILLNDDMDASDLYTEYVTAAMNSYRTTASKASPQDIAEFKAWLAGSAEHGTIAMSMLRTGKTAAIRHLRDLHEHNASHTSYATDMEDDQESGMRAISAQHHHVPEHEGAIAKQMGLMQGIADQLDALDDPIAAKIIMMKYGLGDLSHAYKEQDIASALNRRGIQTADVTRWDADNVKAHMMAALARLAKTKGVKELRDFIKSLRDAEDEQLIKSHVKQYTRQDGTVVESHEDKRVKKHVTILNHQHTHGEEIHTGAKLQHGKELIDSLRSKGWKEREVHQVKQNNGAIGGKKEELPEHEEIKAKNRDNSALQTAERQMKKMRDAAMESDDPVSTLKNINTSRTNTYTSAIDDYREKLLNHFGHSVDRNKTATKFEKDGHSIILSQEGNGHTVHFAGGTPDKDALTSVKGKQERESVDMGQKDAKFQYGEGEEGENVAYTAKMNKVKSKFALVDAHSLTTSHNYDGHVNTAYPQEIQPRDRARIASRMQIQEIANDIKPELYGIDHKTSDGAPIVGKDGIVESGNGRTIALSLAYKTGKADEYKEWLKGYAKHVGLKPEDVDKMDAPMLVRVRQTDVDRPEFAREANQSNQLGQSPTEVAQSDAERIDDAMLAKYQPDDDGDILGEDNKPFVQAFLQKLGSKEAASYVDKYGEPNKKLVDRIQAAVFERVYRSEALTELMTESADSDVKNIIGAMSVSAAAYSKIQKHGDLNVTPELLDAIDIYRSAKRSGNSIDDQLDQAGFDNDGKMTQVHPVTEELARAIHEFKGSKKKLTHFFKTMTERAGDEVSARENDEAFGAADIFGNTRDKKDKGTIVKESREQTKRGDQQEEGGLFRSFQPRAFTHLLRKSRRPNGHGKRENSSKAEADQGGGSGSPEGDRQTLRKAQVSAYERTTADGSLVHVREHEDGRVRRYGRLVQHSKSSYDLHSIRKDRFGHLPHWHSLSEETRNHILKMEGDKAQEHKEWEDWKDKKDGKKPEAVTLQGDKSGWKQAVLFKGKAYTHLYLLRKSVDWQKQKDKDTITVTVKLRDRERSLVRLLQDIRRKANCGHSYTVVTDPDAGHKEAGRFDIDGDGGFHIDEIRADGELVKSQPGLWLLRKSKGNEKGFERLRSRGLQLPTDGLALQNLSKKTVLLIKSNVNSYVTRTGRRVDSYCRNCEAESIFDYKTDHHDDGTKNSYKECRNCGEKVVVHKRQTKQKIARSEKQAKHEALIQELLGKSHPKTICIDFDGVIADYSKGFQGADVFGDPLPGAAAAITKLKLDGWKVIIFTTRKATVGLENYLRFNGIPFDEINSNSDQPEGSNPGKPIADVYLDDRAVRFEDWQQAPADIKAAVPAKIQHLPALRKSRKLHGRIDFRGLPVSIEAGRSRVREWFNPQDGTQGMSRMTIPYGYIRGTMGVDGDQVDVFVGPDHSADTVYVVHTTKAPDFTGYDEDKCFVGVNSPEEAMRYFLAAYDQPKFFGSMSIFSLDEFKEALKTLKGKKLESGNQYIPPATQLGAHPAEATPDTPR